MNEQFPKSSDEPYLSDTSLGREGMEIVDAMRKALAEAEELNKALQEKSREIDGYKKRLGEIRETREREKS
jgi:uncharacterized NAD-dependent epimerase/dehydratase family protein